MKTWILSNSLGFLLVIVVNYLANALPIGGRTTGAVSDSFPNLFTPAGFTFAIWGIIYILLIIFIASQWRFWRGSPSEWLQGIGWLFLASCLSNAAWLIAFQYLKTGLSVLVMLGLLASLILIYQRLQADQTAPFWSVRLPFSVYLGWISVATIANITIWLVSLGWKGGALGEPFWAVLMLIIAVGLGAWMLHTRRDWAFALVIAWALYGIYRKRSGMIDEPGSQPVELVALSGAVLSVLGALYRLFR